MKESDIRSGRYIAWMCYLGILILIPVITQLRNEYTKYHIKQGLTLITFSIGFYVVSFALCTFYLGCLLSSAVAIGILTLQVIGVINAISGKAEPLPFIGKYAELFKF